MKEAIKWSMRSPWIAGQVMIWLLVFLFSLLAAFLLRYTSMEMTHLPLITFSIHALALLIGGIITGRIAGHKGWYFGGLQGMVYGLLLMFISFLAFDSSLAGKPMMFTISAFGIGAIGGIIGVNGKKTAH